MLFVGRYDTEFKLSQLASKSFFQASFPFLSDARSEVSSVVDHDESPAEYHHFNFGCSWQPHFPPYHCHLHFRRPRDATFRQDLHR